MNDTLNKGSMILLLAAKCGVCGVLHRFDPYTNRIIADRDIIDKYGWEYTEEHGLVCHQCAMHTENKYTVIKYPGYPEVKDKNEGRHSTEVVK